MSRKSLKEERIEVFPLQIPESIRHYISADKVYSCAQAEVIGAGEVNSLVWFDPFCLVVNPPLLYELGKSNELVSLTYKDRMIDLDMVNDIEIEEPLRSWLLSREEIKTSGS